MGEIGDVVDDRSRDAIDVLEAGIHQDLMIGLEDRLAVVRNKTPVVEEVECVKGGYWRERLGFVVNEVRRHVTSVSKVRNAKWREQHIDIEGGEDGVICACVRLGFDQEAPPLSGGKTDVLCSSICCLGVDAIHLYNGEVMTLEPDHYAGEVAVAYHVHKVCLSRLHFNLGIHLIIEQTNIWKGSRDTIVRCRLIAGRLILMQENWHLLVVPVRHGQSELFIVFARERCRGIVDNKWCS